MYIVKNLKDYQLSHKQRIFAGYLKDNVDSYVCYEKITNRSAMRKYFAPNSDFVEYSIDKYYNNSDIFSGVFFFRIEKNCLCYANYLEDDSLVDEYCQNIFWEFIQNKEYPHIPGIDGTKEEIDRIEMIYFCNTLVGYGGSDSNKSQYLKLSKFIVFCFFFFSFKLYLLKK